MNCLIFYKLLKRTFAGCQLQASSPQTTVYKETVRYPCVGTLLQGTDGRQVYKKSERVRPQCLDQIVAVYVRVYERFISTCTKSLLITCICYDYWINYIFNSLIVFQLFVQELLIYKNATKKIQSIQRTGHKRSRFRYLYYRSTLTKTCFFLMTFR